MLEQIKNQDTTIIKFEGIEITVFLTRKEYSGTVIELNEDTLKDFVDELKRRPVILGETLSHIFDYSEIKAKLANILNSNPKSAEDIPKEWRKLWNDLYNAYLQDEGLDERYRNAMKKMTFGSTTFANILEQSLLLSSLFNIFVNKIPFRKYPEKKITEKTLASIRELVPFLVIGVNGSVFAPEPINRIRID